MNSLIQNKSIEEVSEVFTINSEDILIISNDIVFVASVKIGGDWLWCEFSWN
jgi:hypothetical protein